MDDGVWRSPGWWRNRELEDRIRFAKIPGAYREADLDKQLEKEDEFWQQGNTLLLRSKNTLTAAKQAGTFLELLLRKHGLSGRFISAASYVEMIKDSFATSGGELPDIYSSPFLLKYLKGVFDVVVLDGLGEEYPTDFSAQALGDLIKSRYEKGLSTVVVTSLSPVHIADKYSPRVQSILDEGVEVSLSTRR